VRELLGRTLHGIAQVLESAKGSEERIGRVLELVRRIVPYEQCALFRAEPGRAPRLVVVPAPPPDIRATLLETLGHLHGRLVDERVQAQEPHARQWGAHLAVPLIGNDAAIGVLFVSDVAPDGPAGGYTEQHLRELAIVAAHLAGYLLIVDQARALDAARADAEAANRMKDEFLALVSHELKTPLTSTLAWAHLLGSEEMPPSERARAVEEIGRSVRTQAKLIDQILELACIVTADLHLDLQPVEAASLIQAAVEEQRQRAEERSIRLETNLDESVHQLVVDPVRIVQVISNLLAKAIHFAPSGGHVGIRLDRAGGHARIQLVDHGKAIPPAVSRQAFEQATGVMSIARLAGIPHGVVSHLFEAFRAGQDPVTRAYGDLGIGLALVKTLVEAHGGRVRAETSAEEDGSTFTVELPLPAEAPQRAGHELVGVRVLLVDDDHDMRAAACAVLELHGAEVTAVASAAAALEALERSRPHVLVSDISMPGESGWDLMRKVAARDATLPAAALSARAKEEGRTRALEAGFRMLLAKPIEAQALVTAVATLAGRPHANGPGSARGADRSSSAPTLRAAVRGNLH
jgi:signal transduction histidine kinase/ActR/RegA family two-component response regulator